MSANNTKETLRARIVQRMVELNIQEKDLATILEIPTSKVHQLLNGERPFTITDATMFCNRLNISLEKLLK